MIELTEDQISKVLESLFQITGPFVKRIFDRSESEQVFLRAIHGQVFLVSSPLLKFLDGMPMENLMGAGLLLGSFDESNRFHLEITCLELIARISSNKVSINNRVVQKFLNRDTLSAQSITHTSNNLKNSLERSVVLVTNAFGLAIGIGETSLDKKGEINLSSLTNIQEYLRIEQKSSTNFN